MRARMVSVSSPVSSAGGAHSILQRISTDSSHKRTSTPSSMLSWSSSSPLLASPLIMWDEALSPRDRRTGLRPPELSEKRADMPFFAASIASFCRERGISPFFLFCKTKLCFLLFTSMARRIARLLAWAARALASDERCRALASPLPLPSPPLSPASPLLLWLL